MYPLASVMECEKYGATTSPIPMNDSPCESAEVVLDFEDLKSRCLGNMDLVERVLTKFAGQLDQDLDDLESAIRDGDAAQAAHFAHRIKGIAASVAARALFDDASTTEECALENELAELPDNLHRLRGDRTKLAESLERSGRRLT
jgi:HPt (histidine-containing phosphotransfer) domain-containing protein